MPVDKNISILVVDDFPSMLKVIHKKLTQIGFTDIDLATGGVDALKKIKLKDYELIISDMCMEGDMTGLDLLELVRVGGNQAQFVLLSAENSPEIKEIAFKIGASDFVLKPFTEETLKASLTRVLGEL